MAGSIISILCYPLRKNWPIVIRVGPSKWDKWLRVLWLLLDYEIYLYDRSGHGFSSHMPKGSDYSLGANLRDLRIITQTLGWTNEKYSFISHSYGAYLAMTVSDSPMNDRSFFVCSMPLRIPRRFHVSWLSMRCSVENNHHDLSGKRLPIALIPISSTMLNPRKYTRVN